MSGSIRKRSLEPQPDRRDVEPLPVDAHGRTVIRATFAVLLALLVLWVAWDFLAPLAWAAVIAITVWPAYVRFADPLPGGAAGVLAPLACTLLIGIVLLVPVVLLVQHVAQGGDAFVRWITELKENGIPVPGWILQAPIVGEHLAIGGRPTSPVLPAPSIGCAASTSTSSPPGHARWEAMSCIGWRCSCQPACPLFHAARRRHDREAGARSGRSAAGRSR